MSFNLGRETVRPWSYWAPQLRIAQILEDPGLFIKTVEEVNRILVAVGGSDDIPKIAWYGSRLARILGASLVFTDPRQIYRVLEMGLVNVTWIKPVSLANRLCDPEWRGVDGKGSYDLVVFTGIPYTTTWTMLSIIGKRAPSLKTITLDKLYHPLATYSFPNLTEDEWHEWMKAILRECEKKFDTTGRYTTLAGLK